MSQFKISWNENYAHPLPEGHRFPMQKYNLIPEQLEYEGCISLSNIHRPCELSDDIITLTHCSNYLQRLNNLSLSQQEIRKTGFPLSRELVKREKEIMQGTIDSALFALENRISLNVAGGTHHAFKDSGEGFCLLNDMAIAANYLLYKNLAKKILIVDLDVHQGNGTASLFQTEQRVFTFSMHGEKNFPARKEKSDLDINLPDGTADEAYLSILKNTLPELIDRHEPDFIFYQSGVDVLESDKLGRLSLSMDACRMRDKVVFDECLKNKIPVSVSMGGGYSEDIRLIVNAHVNTFRLAAELFF
jgi:acetoin utilization deacetylase AcuC-like enzyme